MTNALANTEVVDLDTSVLEDSPMTAAEEKELIMVKTDIAAEYSNRLDSDLAIGKGLNRIFRHRLYRGKNGGRAWDQWLLDESAEMTGGRGTLGKKAALYLRGFYQFRCEILPKGSQGAQSLPLPSGPTQIRPLISQLQTHPEAAIAIWKAAVTDARKKKPDSLPTKQQVQQATTAYKAKASNKARRASKEREAINEYAADVSRAKRKERNEAKTPDYSPQTEATIPAWELEKDNSSIDAGEECKRVTQALTDAHSALSTLHGILHSKINTYGRDYLGFLQQVDAGIYSLSNIEDQVEQLSDALARIKDLITADVGEGELAASTIEVSSFPVKDA